MHSNCLLIPYYIDTMLLLMSYFLIKLYLIKTSKNESKCIYIDCRVVHFDFNSAFFGLINLLRLPTTTKYVQYHWTNTIGNSICLANPRYWAFVIAIAKNRHGICIVRSNINAKRKLISRALTMILSRYLVNLTNQAQLKKMFVLSHSSSNGMNLQMLPSLAFMVNITNINVQMWCRT